MKRAGFTPNPVLVSFMGLCPLVGVTGNFASGAIMALLTALAVLGLDIFWTYGRRFVPQRLALVSQLAFAAFFALLAGVAVTAYSPPLALDLGIYLPLLMVNCLLLHEIRKSITGEARSHASILVTILWYLSIALALSFVRESLGGGTITLPTPGLEPAVLRLFSAPPLPMLVSPAGGFMALAAFAIAQRILMAPSGGKAS
jgi:electron transport complex protein RnfE